MASTPGIGAQGVLVLDEAQERSVASDLLQGLLRDARLGSRPGDLRVVVVTDPTLDKEDILPAECYWTTTAISKLPPTPSYFGLNPPQSYEPIS